MGLSTEKVGSFFTGLVRKGDPRAAMAAGEGPVTAEWAKEHGYTQFRQPGMSATGEILKATKESTSLYGAYAKEKEKKKRLKKVEKETKRKKGLAEERKRKSRLMRRPSRERGIL